MQLPAKWLIPNVMGSGASALPREMKEVCTPTMKTSSCSDSSSFFSLLLFDLNEEHALLMMSRTPPGLRCARSLSASQQLDAPDLVHHGDRRQGDAIASELTVVSNGILELKGIPQDVE